MLRSANLGTQQTSTMGPWAHGTTIIEMHASRIAAKEGPLITSPVAESTGLFQYSSADELHSVEPKLQLLQSKIRAQIADLPCTGNRKYPPSPTIATQVLPSICCGNVITSKYSPKPRLAEPPSTLFCTKYSCCARHPENVCL